MITLVSGRSDFTPSGLFCLAGLIEIIDNIGESWVFPQNCPLHSVFRSRKYQWNITQNLKVNIASRHSH